MQSEWDVDVRMHGGFVKGVSWVLFSTLLGGCATSPDKIKPAYVAPLAYSDLSCDQIREELLRVNNQFVEVYGAQKKTAAKDELVAIAGIFFFPALLFLVTGEDRTDEIGRLKGEAEALGNAAISSNCSYKDTIIAVREVRARMEAARKKQQGSEPGGFTILPVW